MKVALVDVDGHNFPNLALMKLAAMSGSALLETVFESHSRRVMKR